MDEQITGKRFLAVTVLNVLITVVEIIGDWFQEVLPYCPMPSIT